MPVVQVAMLAVALRAQRVRSMLAETVVRGETREVAAAVGTVVVEVVERLDTVAVAVAARRILLC